MTRTNQPIEQVACHSPLYELPHDFSKHERVFTVTLAGPGRRDGEKPYTYVAAAYSTTQAWSRVLAWFMTEEETVDVHVVAEESFEGAPAEDCGYFWTDLRPEFARQAALDDLADQAAETVAEFHANTEDMVRDGDVIGDQQAAYETVLSDAAYSAWPLVLELAAR